MAAAATWLLTFVGVVFSLKYESSYLLFLVVVYFFVLDVKLLLPCKLRRVIWLLGVVPERGTPERYCCFCVEMTRLSEVLLLLSLVGLLGSGREEGLERSWGLEESVVVVVVVLVLWWWPRRSFMILKLKPVTEGRSKRDEGFRPFSLVEYSLQNSGKCSSIPINCLKYPLSLIAGINASSCRYSYNIFYLSSISP